MEITDILDNVWHIDCIGCAIANSHMSPPGGVIEANDAFYVHQDPEVPIPGFLVIGAKKHVKSISEFTEKEYADFTALLYRSRKRLECLPNIHSITLIQEERSQHFHFWLFPWHNWMIEKYGKPSLDHIRSIMAHAKAHLKTATQIQSILNMVEHLKRESAINQQ